MTEKEILITTISLVIGGFISWLITRHYTIKSKLFKKLLIEGVFTSHVIYVDNDIAKDIEISYKDKQINQIYNFIFKVKNIGNSSIGNITKPLTFKIPEGLVFERCSIDQGEEKEITYLLKDNNELVFIFHHLNEEEEFTIDLLLIDFKSSTVTTPNFQELVFVINAEGLKDSKYIINYKMDLDFTIKPFIKIFHSLAFLKPIFISLLGFIRIFFNVIGVILILLLYKISKDNEALNLFNLSLFWEQFNLWSVFILLCWGSTLFVIIIALSSYYEEIYNLWKKKSN